MMNAPATDVARDGHSTEANQLWITAIHESGHALCDRYFGIAVAGMTVVGGDCYSGLTWGPNSLRERGKEVYDLAACEEHDIAATIAEKMAPDLPGPGEPLDGAIFSIVEAQLVALMAGAAAEAVVFEIKPPQLFASDLASAHAVASIVCRNDASRVALIEHAFQEARTICDRYKVVLLALARALTDHPEQTLDGQDIDRIIAMTLAHEAMAAEHARRERWRQTISNAERFHTEPHPLHMPEG